MTAQRYILAHPVARRNAAQACNDAPEGYVVEIKPPKRSLDQSAKFHAICGDVAQQKEFAGKPRAPEVWKMLFVSGHAVATRDGAEMAPGLEGEWCNLRESTAKMSKARMASLVEYTLAWCIGNDVRLSAREDNQR